MSRKRDRQNYRSFAAPGPEAMRRMAEPQRARKPNKRRRNSVLKGLLSGIATGLIVVIGLHMTLPGSGAVIKPTVVRTIPIAPPRY
jgi:hypothetical protein